MKKLLYIAIACIFLSTSALAQQNSNQIESVKAAFITQKLDLSTEEAQRFWPVYNSYQQDLKKLVTQKQKERQELRKTGAVIDELKFDTEVLELKKRYRAAFSKILPKQKVALLYQAEREFRQELIQQLHKRKGRR